MEADAGASAKALPVSDYPMAQLMSLSYTAGIGRKEFKIKQLL
jgi:hypothetical protein